MTHDSLFTRLAPARWLTALLVLAAAAAVRAQEAQPKLDLTMTGAKEVRVQENGVEVIKQAPVESTASGDILVYTIAYANAGAAPVVGAGITGNVPDGTRLILGSEQQEAGIDVLFSINGGQTFLPLPITVPVKQADGTVQRQPAPPDMFTQIRWQFTAPLPPGAAGKVSYKVKVK